MPYKICDYAHEPGMVSYVNAESTSPQNGWVTTLPVHEDEQKKYHNPTQPKIFETKEEASEYLDAVNFIRLHDWNENSMYYKSKGRKKPQWKIYPVL